MSQLLERRLISGDCGNGVKGFGSTVRLGIEGGNKFWETEFVGVDEEYKGVRVYWRDTTKTVTVERNIDNSSASHLEGEITETNANSSPPDANKAQNIPAQEISEIEE